MRDKHTESKIPHPKRSALERDSRVAQGHTPKGDKYHNSFLKQDLECREISWDLSGTVFLRLMQKSSA